MIKFRWTLRETVVEGCESAEVSKYIYIYIYMVHKYIYMVHKYKYKYKYIYIYVIICCMQQPKQ